MVELAAPWMLALAPLPLLALWRLRGGAVTTGALHVPDRIGSTLLAAGATAGPGRRLALRSFALWLVWCLLVLAAAGPREPAPVPALKVSGRDLAFVIDLSGSMVRDDFDLNGTKITRLEAVKTVGAAFARRRGGDRMAFVVFGSQAYYATPFTFDVHAVAQAIEAATIGISGRATNMSDGLGLALKRMSQSEAASRVVILLSDGVNNAGATHPRAVAALAAQMGVRVHTIALGPKDLADAYEGENGVVDVATLRDIARLSGGESFRVRTTADLDRVATALDRLEATDSDGLAAEIYHDYWPWPAGAAAFVLLGLLWRAPA